MKGAQRGAQGSHEACGVQGCPASAADGATICRSHQQRFRDRLREVPGLLAELRLTISRQAVMEQHSGKAAETPLPWDERAALVDAWLRTCLGMIARATADRHTDERDPLVPALAEGAAEVSRWVARNLHTTGQLDMAGEAFETLDSACHRSRVIIDRPVVRARFYVGPCPALQGEGDAYPGRPCPGEVWASVPEDADDSALLRCQADRRHRWDATQWKRLAKRIQQRVRELTEAGLLP